MNRDIELIFDHLVTARALLEERRDYTCDGDDDCLDAYRVALCALRKAEKLVDECHHLECWAVAV